MQVYQQFDANIVPPAYSFIKIETPAQVFSCEFWKKKSACIFIKSEIQLRCFPVNFAKFSRQ